MTPYRRGTLRPPRIRLIDAAVDWQGLPPVEWRYIYVDANGLPHHLDQRSLVLRAQALLDAAHRRQIQGLTHSKDGFPLPVQIIWLCRESVTSWILKNSHNFEPLGQHKRNDDDI